MNSVIRLLFDSPWGVLSTLGAASTWGLWWLLARPAAPTTVHLAIWASLALTYRACAWGYEREAHRAPLRHHVGGIGLALTLLTTGALAGLVLGSSIGHLLMAASPLTVAQAGTAHVPTPPGPDVLGLVGLLGGLGFVVDGYVRGYRALDITRLEFPLPNLPAALDGLRIVQLSDLHVGPLMRRRALRDAVSRARGLDPDVLVITGDIADSIHTDLAHWLPELAPLDARFGVYVVLGNHDERLGLDTVAADIERHTPWRVLRDEIATLDVEGHRLHLIGLEYRGWEHAGDAVASLVARVPTDEPRLMLGHFPSVFGAARASGVPLTLVGHTHGGQLAWPGLPRLNVARLFMTRYDAGTFHDGPSTLHVSRGLGTSTQPIRIGTPREITVITLRSPASAVDDRA